MVTADDSEGQFEVAQSEAAVGQQRKAPFLKELSLNSSLVCLRRGGKEKQELPYRKYKSG